MIGLLPCAGRAERIHGLPKALLPCPGGYLLDKHCREMRAAGVDKLLVGANRDNDDLLRAYAPPDATIYTVNTQTMSETVLAARKYTYDADVLFGMPDTWWHGESVYDDFPIYLDGGWDVAVAAWPIRDNQRGQGGQLKLERDGSVSDVVDKDPSCDYPWIWGAIGWTSKFWEFIKPDMPHIGYALKPAIDAGLTVKATWHHRSGGFYDCGTTERYFELAATWTIEEEVSNGI